MVIDDTSICFINVHLAAGQSQRAARTADLGGIMEDRAIFPAAEDLPFVNGGDGTAILDHELVVLNGDLNVSRSYTKEIANTAVSDRSTKGERPL
jgi:endonuclease/exonuclease/phosphatase family metal-dependent hydrolase